MKKTICKDDYRRYDGPIHLHFGLSYCAYFTVPRLALQGMPLWWQKIFLWLVNMLPSTPEYCCQRRDENGKFIKDPWANYRRGSIKDIILQEQNAEKTSEWKIINVRNNHK